MLSEKRNTSIMVTIAIVSLLVAIIPAIVTSDSYFAFAHSCHNHDHDDDDHDHDGDNSKSNEAEQSISQGQFSVQSSQVVSGGDSIGSGNNVGLFFNDNIGNLALGQQ
ncbi:MAG TPA: hypothetical protein VFG45_04330 [Candidatus Nitrosocosmicus sp.]|nr:hypothetical protein [Candidatus Nitrosocosmicus sp.]